MPQFFHEMREMGHFAEVKAESVLQADAQLTISFVYCTDCLDAMASEIVGGMLEVIFSTSKRTKRGFDLGMFSCSGRRR